jgi:diguanylate cyclase (GGDEF)-like protein
MVNDTYGHQIGDEVLKEISKIALDNVREQDITVRWGGEEFFILLPQTNLSGAVIVANKIRISTQNHIFTEKSLKITASFGVTQFCIENDDEKTIITRADELLYEAKRSGKNKVMS